MKRLLLAIPLGWLLTLPASPALRIATDLLLDLFGNSSEAGSCGGLFNQTADLAGRGHWKGPYSLSLPKPPMIRSHANTCGRHAGDMG